ncbi:MAG: hypothetical protein JWP38_3707 [Herbaspirillum sp.]|nr:hypothetical protein [Herbaspirillum sp.]
MKKLILAATLVFASVASAKDVYVQGYTRNNGTYVEPYHRSAPDNTQMNNYSTQGNVNPYTGQAGTRQPQPTYPGYQQPVQTICPYGQQC